MKNQEGLKNKPSKKYQLHCNQSNGIWTITGDFFNHCLYLATYVHAACPSACSEMRISLSDDFIILLKVCKQNHNLYEQVSL